MTSTTDFSVFKLIGRLAHIHLLFDTVDQQLLAFRWFLDFLLLNLLFQIFNDRICGVDPNVPSTRISSISS